MLSIYVKSVHLSRELQHFHILKSIINQAYSILINPWHCLRFVLKHSYCFLLPLEWQMYAIVSDHCVPVRVYTFGFNHDKMRDKCNNLYLMISFSWKIDDVAWTIDVELVWRLVGRKYWIFSRILYKNNWPIRKSQRYQRKWYILNTRCVEYWIDFASLKHKTERWWRDICILDHFEVRQTYKHKVHTLKYYF